MEALLKNLGKMFASCSFKGKWKAGADENFSRLYDFILLNYVTGNGNKKIIIIDCGNSFDPYRLAGLVKNTALKQAGRNFRRDYRDIAARILGNILVSRMFTAHQLKSRLSALFAEDTEAHAVSLSGVPKARGVSAKTEAMANIMLIIHNIDRLIYDYYATAENSPYVVNDGVIEDILALIDESPCPAVVTTRDEFFHKGLVTLEISGKTAINNLQKLETGETSFINFEK